MPGGKKTKEWEEVNAVVGKLRSKPKKKVDTYRGIKREEGEVRHPHQACHLHGQKCCTHTSQTWPCR